MSTDVPARPINTTIVFQVAGILGALGIIAGAFTAHGLEDWLIARGDEQLAEKRLSQAEVGVRYHLLHAVALLAFANLWKSYSVIKYRIIFALMIAGVILFSGSLYGLVLLNKPVLGAITPIGGVAWIVAWVLIAMPCKNRCH